MRARASVVLALLLAGGASGAVRADEQHREGEYGGVTPGQGSGSSAGSTAAPKGKHPRRPPPKDELTWVGFQGKEGGGGELFFQAPGAFTVSQHVDHGQVVILLEGLRRQVRNTRRPLDTRYFDAPIARVTARAVGARGGKDPHKAGIEVRIAFKNPKDAHEATARTATEADGMFYAYLDFGSAGTTAAPEDKDRTPDQPPDEPKAQVKDTDKPGAGAGSDDQ
jgi:hypothetical protein